MIGSFTTETTILSGNELSQNYIDFIEENQLVEPTDHIHYWYSDAAFDIEEGVYFFTDEKVVVFSNLLEEPVIIIPYEQIVEVDFQKSESDWVDSYVILSLEDYSTISIPVTVEEGGDHIFFNDLRKTWGAKVQIINDLSQYELEGSLN
ncbi:hypothetical protein [Sediminitomix flava]|uniref:YokE-like PH domain-containing protein n=1 Tax=Sediminitomix flava TaxID=379075 RepID=A0A315ZC66_SEDFL|nr:hypothetical protein [Sediminitomix flava]PWJ43166.1 hypothetical protein BC781_102715 [Sediminitomix flava]